MCLLNSNEYNFLLHYALLCQLTNLKDKSFQTLRWLFKVRVPHVANYMLVVKELDVALIYFIIAKWNYKKYFLKRNFLVINNILYSCLCNFFNFISLRHAMLTLQQISTIP